MVEIFRLGDRVRFKDTVDPSAFGVPVRMSQQAWDDNPKTGTIIEGPGVNVSPVAEVINQLFKDNPDKVLQTIESPRNVGWFVGQTMRLISVWPRMKPSAETVNKLILQKLFMKDIHVEMDVQFDYAGEDLFLWLCGSFEIMQPDEIELISPEAESHPSRPNGT